MTRNANEVKLCIAFTEHLAIYFPRTPGILNYTHIANEGRSPQEGSKLKKMGVKAGWFDYPFVWFNGTRDKLAFLEAKWGKNDFSPSQKEFMHFMIPMGIPCEKFYSVEQGHKILLSLGIKSKYPCNLFREPNTMTWEEKMQLNHNLYKRPEQ